MISTIYCTTWVQVIVGALSARDLLRQRASDAISLGDNIAAAKTPAELGRIWKALTTVARGLVYEDVDPRDIGAVISRELCALTRRACEVAEDEMLEGGSGPPPTPYAFLVLGSGGRGESLLAMDQDNALVFEEGETGGPIDAWFAQLGQRVADILNEAGVAYCTGGVMAANDAWRKDIAGWHSTVDGWLRRTSPEDILSADIFFDALPVHGSLALGEKLRDDAMAAAASSQPFLHALALGACNFQTPVGWFGRFRTNGGRIDLKKGGIMPLFSTARVLALRYRITARSTPDRFDGTRELIENGGTVIGNLIEAHRILLDAILRQQLRDLEAGIKLSNSVAPGDLTANQRQQLKWALAQVPSVADVLGTPLSVLGQ